MISKRHLPQGHEKSGYNSYERSKIFPKTNILWESARDSFASSTLRKVTHPVEGLPRKYTKMKKKCPVHKNMEHIFYCLG